jgi:hypothetical protein
VLIASYREYRKAADMGPSVFCTIRDALGLDPKYKPHRNVDAVRCAKLMSKFIKQKQCRRAMSIEGRLTWRFNDMAAYYQAVDTLQLEQGVHTECMFVRDSRASPVETQGAASLGARGSKISRVPPPPSTQ